MKKVNARTRRDCVLVTLEGNPIHLQGRPELQKSFYDGPLKKYRMNSVNESKLRRLCSAENPEIAMAVLVPWAYKVVRKSEIEFENR